MPAVNFGTCKKGTFLEKKSYEIGRVPFFFVELLLPTQTLFDPLQIPLQEV